MIRKKFESLLCSLEAGGSDGENLVRSILAGGSYQILTTIRIFLEEPQKYKEVRRLTNLLQWTERGDISKLYPEARVELGRRIAEYLREIAKHVPDNKRPNFYKSLIESISTFYSLGRVGRQREHQSLPRAQPVSQQSSVLTYEEFVKILKEECSDRKVAERLKGREISLLFWKV